MPGIDGFETCKRLKIDPDTRDIPVIFVTAKTELEDIVRGFEIGGVDYIVKPFKREEVLSRVKTHLKIERLMQDKECLNKKLQHQNDKLIESQNQYRIILQKSSDGVFHFDAEGRLISSNTKFHSALKLGTEGIVVRSIMDIVISEDPSGIFPKIATRRFGDRATSNLAVQFCVNKSSSILQDRKIHNLLLDSYGIWNLPNNKLYEKGKEKKYLGTICIVKIPS